jgi:hypothetical protein
VDRKRNDLIEKKLSYLKKEYLIDGKDAVEILEELERQGSLTGEEDESEFAEKFDNRFFGRWKSILELVKNFLKESCFFRGCKNAVEEYFDYERYFYNEMTKTFFYVKTEQGFFLFSNEI